MVDVEAGSRTNMHADTDSNMLADSTNKLISNGGTSGASWAALRADLREH